MVLNNASGSYSGAFVTKEFIADAKVLGTATL